MYVYVNDRCIRTYGDTRRRILDYTDWHNNATYKELKMRYRWLKEDDVLKAECHIKRR